MKYLRQIAHRVWNAVPMSWRTTPIGRFLATCYHLSDNDWYGLKVHCTLIARTARLRLLAAGLPLERRFLIVRCLGGEHSAGLFSEFVTVLGALEHYERWCRQYAGLRVDFADQGLYYDAAHGANWWQYHFEPIEIGSSGDAVTSVANLFSSDLFTLQGERLSRKRAFEIIDRYIRAKPHMRKKVDAYVRANFADAYVIGIHYRGTDKFKEAPRVAYEQVHAAVLDAIRKARPARHKLFIATDEQAFLDYMLRHYPSGLLYREIFRSADGTPIDVVNDDSNYRKGEDAVVDCLLLARANILIRTASALSMCSTFFSPSMPVTLLKQERE